MMLRLGISGAVPPLHVFVAGTGTNSVFFLIHHGGLGEESNVLFPTVNWLIF